MLTVELKTLGRIPKVRRAKGLFRLGMSDPRAMIPIVEDLKSAYYEQTFRLKYLETGEGFQAFFSTLMELAYPNGDFVRVRPWGNVGDRKNDGYLRSKRRLFQCFGPTEMKPISICIAKVKEDFKGALPFWKQHFDEWIFVHNDVKGLPADVLKLLLDLSKKNAPLVAKSWGYSDLLTVLKTLSASEVATLLGPAPGLKDVVAIRVEDVRLLLEHIALQPESTEVDVRTVPATKLQYNQLSHGSATLLKMGMTRAEVVKKYLRGLVDQTRYDRVAAAFRLRYSQLRSEGATPDDIFVRLQRFVSGDVVASTSHQAATLAILAFFFEACEIFERPPGETGAAS